MIRGTPKFGTVNVGSADNHGGHGYKNAVIDDYPIKFGLRATAKPAETPKPRKRRYYGVKES